MAEEQAPASTEEAPQQTEDVSRETTEQEVMERPEIIPEKFWNNETGEINLEDMAKSALASSKTIIADLLPISHEHVFLPSSAQIVFIFLPTS